MNTNYPYVFVHGLMGWGEYDAHYKIFPYWGMFGGELLSKLEKKGYECRGASVSGTASAWDRACELYAQLTGSQIRCPITQTPLHMTCLLTMRWS